VIAIMAIDPGKTTGVARGLFGPGMEAGLKDALANAVSLETWEVEGTAPVQCWELVSEFHDWVYGLVAGGVLEVGEVGKSVCLVVEDFRLRTQNVDLDPVLIIGGLTTLLVPRSAGLAGTLGAGEDAVGTLAGSYALGATVAFQQPADAFRFATADRLAEWMPGGRSAVLRLCGGGRGRGGGSVSEHRRDAFRHLLFRLAVEMGGVVMTRAAPLGSTSNPVVRKGAQRGWARSAHR
jgi:hypothetical protein